MSNADQERVVMTQQNRWTGWLALAAMASMACASAHHEPVVVQIASGSPSPSPSSGTVVIRQSPAHVPGEVSTAPPSSGPPSSVPASAVGDFAPRIDNEAMWNALAASPSREMAAHTQVVKFIIDYEDHDRVYFLQTSAWEIHYYFIQHFLSHPGHLIPDAPAFWQREYLSNDRRFVQGTITHYRDQNVWAVELIAQDVLDVPRSIRAFQLVRDHVSLPGLRYHPIPPHHIAALDVIRAQIPVVTTDEIFAHTRFQPLNPGEAFGYLRFFDGPVDAAHVRPFDIVVLADVPLDLPVCAGVITAELQTPLSHIAVLSANRRTPNMALRGANHEATLRRYEGQLVHLHVTPQEYTLVPATQSEAEHAWNERRPATEQHLRVDPRDTGLPMLAQLHVSDLDTVGAKAAQLGDLAQIRPALPLPRGFAIPFHAYLDHLHAHGLDAQLTTMLNDPTFQSDPVAREHALAAFRDRITQSPIAPALVQRVRAQIERQFPGGRVRFRSSTNAEDLPGFNGAGLYESVRTERAPTEAQVGDAIRRVWASTWNFQGFEERSYYRIVQRDVAMGILVQESIDTDQVAGVAITGNPFDEGRPGYFINAQVSAGSVTSASSGEVPEQDLFYTYPPPGAVERVSTSSRTGGRPVLSVAEVTQLAHLLHQIHANFYVDVAWQTHEAMDVEFLFAGTGADRHPVIVQARPYSLRFDEGRTYARPPGSPP